MNTLRVAQKGFNLIELMIIVAVIAILTSVAMPQYADYVTRGKLTEGVSNLADGRVKMEQFFQDNRTYSGGPVPATTTNFTYALSSLGTASYIITATGRGSISDFSYSVNQANTQATTAVRSGWGTTTTSCWHTKKGGSC
jgi:type IV pilus assembly protein PilE